MRDRHQCVNIAKMSGIWTARLRRWRAFVGRRRRLRLRTVSLMTLTCHASPSEAVVGPLIKQLFLTSIMFVLPFFRKEDEGLESKNMLKKQKCKVNKYMLT